jgi:hypothetical protein
VDLFRQLFSQEAAEHAYALLRKQNPLVSALSGNPAVDAWRAWLDARQALAQARPRDALERLERLAVVHDIGDTRLAAVEVTAVIAECLAQGNQPLAALDTLERLGDQLFDFAQRAADDPQAAGDELRLALKELTGAHDLTVNSADLVGSWALGRGLQLLLDRGVRQTGLLVGMRANDPARAAAVRLADDVAHFHSVFGVAFGPAELEHVQFALGDAWTELDAQRALDHFVAAGGEQGHNLAAAANLTNCLLRLGRFAEAAASYESLESAFELQGDYLGAARVWAGECIARWKETHDPSIRHSLIGAIKFFEENLPPTADPATLYTLKLFNEPALTLLVAILAASEDRSDGHLEELLSALWAMQRPELKADLESDPPSVDGWPSLLAQQSRRLEITKAMLEPFPRTRVVHFCSATDELVLVGYGYDDDHFCLEASTLGKNGASTLLRFLELMDEQLAADLRRDEAQVAVIGEELAACGAALGAALSPAFVELLRKADRVFFMPHGSVDLFPLGGLRFDGTWLAESTIIMRTPTPNHLRETLSATRPAPAANNIARTVTGDPNAGPAALQELEAEAARIVHILGVLGFDADRIMDATIADLTRLLDGGAGITHYVGHGIASDVYEGLPLRSGEILRPAHLTVLPGFTTGFVFLCACEAGSVRSGAGGYQTGIASRLVERGAPAAVAFTHPVLEERASHVARQFYRCAATMPFGLAVREMQRNLVRQIPEYAWLSVAAFGDPELRLPDLAAKDEISSSSACAKTWHSALRTYAVLRTDGARSSALAAVTEAPEELRAPARALIQTAFADPPATSTEWLDEFDSALLGFTLAPVELLSLHAVAALERAHLVGLDAFPISFPEPGQATRVLFHELEFAAEIGATLFDTRLNGLAHALIGRLLAWDQGNIQAAARPLGEARDKLREAAALAPFLARIHEETKGIIRQFAG